MYESDQESGLLQTTTIDLLRHGEPEGGTLFRGWRDDPLSAEGWAQMRHSTRNPPPWELIISSPLSRCCHFAAELSQRLGVPMEKDDRLKEIGFGEWEGKSPAVLYDESPDRLSAFWQDPVKNPPPGGEPMVLFQSRVESAWQDIQVHHAGKHLLIVAHGGVNRLILGKVLGMSQSHLFRMEWPFAAVSRVSLQDGYPQLTFHCGSLD
ncbi:MAG: alpha-ribazole phosphatase family protein [Sedimenticola sp.]|nr:alpha-ribazole phosphatase family protein [Sedimenticola sp.]